MEMQKNTACSTEMDDQATILQTIDLKVAFRIGGRELPVVDSVSLELKRPEHTALLGETGCGKSILALAILGLLPANTFVEGMIRGLGHTDLLALSPIPGAAPSLATMPGGCRFYPRCAEADRRCGNIHPALSGSGKRLVRCFHAGS
jgi:oligopeptide/dipeptide ABC transporter ATP-binding protein